MHRPDTKEKEIAGQRNGQIEKNRRNTAHSRKLMEYTLACGVIFAASGTCRSQDWTLGPFRRMVNAPVITPVATQTFLDPITEKAVRWEALNTFNPAAVVKDGKIYVLYRAEDDSGPMRIGMHTSRLGIAWSDDGIHFNRGTEPVFSLPMMSKVAASGQAELRIPVL